MSMLSAQVDELRELADDIESRYGYPTAVKALRYAADTICQLRDDLQRANAENAKLRDEFDKMDKWHSAELIAEMDENAKLREELAKACDPQRIGGQADPESFVYAIEQLREFRWQHATNDEDAIPYINKVAEAHERENAKLRELAREACEMARAFYNLGGTFNDLDDLLCEAAELGIEVDG